MRPIIDAHLDIAWNALSFDRDQLLELGEMRRREAGMSGAQRARCTVSLPEMRRASVRICLPTLLCRAFPAELPEMDGNVGELGNRRRGEIILREDLDYANQAIACAMAQGQLAYYRLLEEQGHLRLIRNREDLQRIWSDGAAPLGGILSMEGCDPIIEPSQAAWWYDQGLRTACLAHYGPSAYAMGTGGDGTLTPKGRELVREFERLGILVDLVHTADTAIEQILEQYEGPVFISHGNCRALVPHDRQITDEQLRWVAERSGVIGVVLDEWMLVPGYVRGEPSRPRATLEDVANHIDHICETLASSRHVGIGSDLDGGFGTEQTPLDLQSIFDLHRLEDILAGRGYPDEAIEGIFSANWYRFFAENLRSETATD